MAKQKARAVEKQLHRALKTTRMAQEEFAKLKAVKSL